MATLKQICLVTLVSVLGNLTVQALPAKAVVYDAAAIRHLQDRRTVLKTKENNLLIDNDEIRKQIDDLNRRNDHSLDRRIDELNRKLDWKFSDLQQVRGDLKDVEVKML